MKKSTLKISKWKLFVSLFCILIISACKQKSRVDSNSINNKNTIQQQLDSSTIENIQHEPISNSVSLNTANTVESTTIKSINNVDLDSIQESNLKSSTPSTTKQKTVTQAQKRNIRKKTTRGKLHFPNPNFNFGILVEGDEIDHSFQFKNIGNKPIDIKTIEVSCGCTTPSYPFTSIPPGKTATIDVSYSSLNKWGNQKASLTVWTNGSPSKYVLFLEGVVHEREK